MFIRHIDLFCFCLCVSGCWSMDVRWWCCAVAEWCVYEVEHRVVFTSTFSPHHLTLTLLVQPLLAGRRPLSQVGPRHSTKLRLLGSAGHGERSTWHEPMVKTLHRNLKPSCHAWCLIGPWLIAVFRRCSLMVTVAVSFSWAVKCCQRIDHFVGRVFSLTKIAHARGRH